MLDQADLVARRIWVSDPGGGVFMRLYFDDADPVAECECRWRTKGDSINDALIAWGQHVTGTPDCREKL